MQKEEIFVLFIFKLSQPQYDYIYSLNGWYQVITAVKFNSKTAMQYITLRHMSHLTNATA